MPNIRDRVRNAWNAFTSRDPTNEYSYGQSFYQRPYQRWRGYIGDKTIVTSIYNTISLDVAAVQIKHVRLDSNERYLSDIDDGLNQCLTLRANTDQTARDFIQDLVISMFDEGCVAVVPVEASNNPLLGTYDIKSLRVGKIVSWYPQHVKVKLYNEWTGKHEEKIFSKSMVSIHTNPLYSVMNEPNSTLKRLLRKLALLDMLDESNSSGKLDLIIQLPYIVKSKTQQQQAEKRREDIERQLVGSKYGIAYTDGTERITQLNRPVENNLLTQIETLTSTLYGQLGLTDAVMNGTADEKTMLNYYNRTVEPVLAAITDPMIWTFLSKTARTQGQSIKYFRDAFRLASLRDIADTADVFCRNEITSSNEIRQVMGMKPSDDPKADMLVNSNMPQSSELNDTLPEYVDEGVHDDSQNETASGGDEVMDVPISSITN